MVTWPLLSLAFDSPTTGARAILPLGAPAGVVVRDYRRPGPPARAGDERHRRPRRTSTTPSWRRAPPRTAGRAPPGLPLESPSWPCRSSSPTTTASTPPASPCCAAPSTAWGRSPPSPRTATPARWRGASRSAAPSRCEPRTFGDGYEGLACDGMPSDCVRIGLLGVRCPLPDLVVSGVNAGGNMGADTTYSGTVGAAFEAALRGYPALAFSVAELEPGLARRGRARPPRHGRARHRARAPAPQHPQRQPAGPAAGRDHRHPPGAARRRQRLRLRGPRGGRRRPRRRALPAVRAPGLRRLGRHRLRRRRLRRRRRHAAALRPARPRPARRPRELGPRPGAAPWSD